MSKIQDRREDIVNQLVMWAMRHGVDGKMAKYDFYMILNGVEIVSRSTEIAEIQEDRNKFLLKKFLIAKKVAGCTEKTIGYYAKECTKILDRIGKTVDQVTPDDIRYYMAIRLRKDKVSDVTVGSEIRALGSFYGWLYLEELIKSNPMAKVDRIKVKKQKKEALTEMEIEKLRAAAEGEKEKLIIELLLSTGCRVSEIVQILISEIENNRILVHGKGNKDRYVYLNARAQLSLENYLKERKDNNPYLFPRGPQATEMWNMKGAKRRNIKDWWKCPEFIREGHMDKSSVECMTRKIAKRAGVEKANPHKFRRTCATLALRRGMPIEQVSKMLGHENISTTQIYLDLSEDDLALAHQKYVV